MVFKTTSWHYRVWAWSHFKTVDDEELHGITTNLCSYFWRVMFALLWLPLLSPIMLLGKVCWLPIRYLNRNKINKRHWYLITNTAGGNSVIVGLFSVIPLGTLMLGAMIFYEDPWMVVRTLEVAAAVIILFVLLLLCGYMIVSLEELSPDSKLYLIGSYLKAKKEKVCPLVTFKNKKSR